MGNRESRNGSDVATLHQGLELLGRGALLVAESSPRLLEHWERVDERLQRVEGHMATLQHSIGRVETHLEQVEDELARLRDRDQNREARLVALEGCIEKALVRMFPRVEALLSQLEKSKDVGKIIKAEDKQVQRDSRASSFRINSIPSEKNSISKRYLPIPECQNNEAASTSTSFTPPECAVTSNANNTLYEDWGETTEVWGGEWDNSLLEAAKEGRVEDIHWLVSTGANLNTENMQQRTPLMVAAYEGHAECLSLLLQAGADVNCRDMNEFLPLHAAACRGHEAAVRVLVHAGVDVNARDGITGSTALIRAASKGHAECVSALLGSCADMEIRDDDGMTALHRAVMYGHTTTVSLLLDAGADVNSVDQRGWSSLDYAIRSGTERVKKVLEEKRPRDIEAKQCTRQQ